MVCENITHLKWYLGKTLDVNKRVIKGLDHICETFLTDDGRCKEKDGVNVFDICFWISIIGHFVTVAAVWRFEIWGNVKRLWENGEVSCLVSEMNVGAAPSTRGVTSATQGVFQPTVGAVVCNARLMIFVIRF